MKDDDPLREVLLERHYCRTLVGAAAFLLAVLAGCWHPHQAVRQLPHNLGWLKDEPLDRGNSHPFAADYEAVVGAARQAVHEVGLAVAEDYPVNDSTWMMLCASFLLLPTSWWEGSSPVTVVRVVVQRLGERQTAVRVISRRPDPLQAWKKEYSQDIFAALIEKLEEWPQRPEPSPAAPSSLERILGQRFFAADYEAVVRAAREAVQEMGITLREDYPGNDSTWVILCEKYARSFRVVVQRLGERQTAVRVISRRRETTDPIKVEEYSHDIFAALIEKLEGQPHLFAVGYEAVVSAAREAVQEVGLELRDDYPVNDSTWVILCAKHAQFLRVVVQRLGEQQTAVRVIFRRGEAVEVWRMEDYSHDILTALIEKLEGKPQRPEPSPAARNNDDVVPVWVRFPITFEVSGEP